MEEHVTPEIGEEFCWRTQRDPGVNIRVELKVITIFMPLYSGFCVVIFHLNLTSFSYNFITRGLTKIPTVNIFPLLTDALLVLAVTRKERVPEFFE